MGLIIDGASARDLILDGQSVSLYEGGSPPVKVWPTQRTLSIRTHYASPNNLWTSGTQAGATDLIVYFSERYIRLSEDVTCNRPVSAMGTISPGDGIPAGRDIYPLDWGVAFTFTTTKIRPPTRVVQITLDAAGQAQGQFRTALSARGLNYTTVTEIPFDIELVGTGSVQYMFDGCAALTSVPTMDTRQVTNMTGMFDGCYSLTSVPDMNTSRVTNMTGMFDGCSALTHAPDMDTGQVTNMNYMFLGCSSLTSVPDMNTSQVTGMVGMFQNCSALTDGNVRLIGRHPNVDTTYMILYSGLTREPFHTTDGGTAEVHQVSLTDVYGDGTVHPLVTVTVPAGQTWSVTIEGTVTRTGRRADRHPRFRIGATTSDVYAQGAAVNFGGTISATDSTIAVVTGSIFMADQASFVGTVTIEK